MDQTQKIIKRWEGKFIVLGVTGSIAAYKSAEILRRIQDDGGEVQVVMTKTATRLMSPETLRELSGHRVLVDLFDDEDTWQIGHISLSDRADALLIAPATANLIAKIAHGLADDLLTSTVLAFRKPILLAPAMNDAMWTNPITQENLLKLKKRGIIIVPPGEGYLACKRIGTGRLADIPDILGGVGYALEPRKDLAGKRFLISAGPTQEPMDPVRYLTNPSTGKMGYALAQAAYERGADVTLVTGPTLLRIPFGVRGIPVRTADEMATAIFEYTPGTDVIIMTAAVADFKPAHYSQQKIKKSGKPDSLKLEPTVDILKELGTRKKNKILVGFAAETQDLTKHAIKKINDKNLDMIVVNDVSRPEIGFGSDQNAVTLITKSGGEENLSIRSKYEISELILDRILELS
jgi:phosphopantothenoylcysteine decarboxylase/phosphopantothenate--cysteine ligase